MRALVLREYGVMPSLEEYATPEPGLGEALIRVQRVGLCATDLKLINGALPPSGLPRIPGHEIAGVVEICESRPGLVGRRVACHLYQVCGKCRQCRKGRDSLCVEGRRAGIERDGGLAEWLVVDSSVLLPFSDDTPFELAAVAMDAVTSPWAALHEKGDISEGEFVVIVGCGGLGSNALQIARAAGCRVAVIDPVEENRELGQRLGAELALDPSEVGELSEWSDGGADLSLETSGKQAGFGLAVAAVAPGGRIVCNGYQPGVDYGLDSAKLVLEEIRVQGSRAGNRQMSQESLAAVERGDVKPPIMDVVPLAAAPEALQMLAEGRVRGRIVVDPTR